MRAQLPLALLLASTTVACVDNARSADPSKDEVASAIEQENGGLDTTDEAPMFAEEAAFDAAAIEPDSAVDDPMLASDPVLADMAGPTSTALARDLIIMWGRMPADKTATTPRDWSGELRLSRGGMLVRHRIAFEERTDGILPRTSRDAISFTSITRPASDGLALAVFDPDPSNASPLTLTYTPVAGTAHTLDLSQLENGPIVVDAGDGNKVVIAGHRRNDSCAHGFLRGRWHALAPRAAAYRGVVANSAGEPVGHIRGFAGVRQNGDAVMFGKFIDREGHFKGLLKGTYENGTFVARWIDRAGDHGKLGGVYFPGATERGGGFLGRWAETSCEAP